ncbi:hypothetical protein PF005_g25831 [Phytophthora fragariae]|uniref:Myb-like domain-containing protein n=1 Tax=Phytophthora fragariae TaxID=53985 RepID=A0A6A3WL72_9STRA|nr:hypothetical protein PF009_g28828 [Phytophthora fragariae]KAE8976456.1 hypothetical protein PF011_g24048 [Phytophthora fragariae]KAE9067451.1 hypothetical protein PF010_g27453 [Phytophthora fragariae]KAE9174490.1 hypothetical protein PF005_g25831 [Phytophthora fragariae]KAE9182186.1 hypothetical protein PF004_g24316 [Phytophthora fragariae]
MAESRKRRNFSEEEDVMLLKQALADEPFRHEHGKVMEAWDSLATTLAACPDFARKNLSGKTAQNRVNALLESHTEKDTLLDELLSKIEDIKVEKANRKRIKAEETAAQESAGEPIRRLAVERLKRQRDDDQADVNESPSHSNKFAKLVDLLREQKVKELAARQKQWEGERLDRQATEKRFMQLLELLAKRG